MQKKRPGLSGDAERMRESRRILERARRDSDVVGASAFSRSVNEARDHFTGRDADPNDPIEVWGRRIGRTLGLVGFIGLAIWLVLHLTRTG